MARLDTAHLEDWLSATPLSPFSGFSSSVIVFVPLHFVVAQIKFFLGAESRRGLSVEEKQSLAYQKMLDFAVSAQVDAIKVFAKVSIQHVQVDGAFCLGGVPQCCECNDSPAAA